MQPIRNSRFVPVILNPFMLSRRNHRATGGISEMGDNIQTDYSRRVQNKSTNSFKKQQDPRETAQYIADMVLELRNMAKAADHKTLQGLLEVSFYEAFSAANRVEIPDQEIEHLRQLSKASGA